MSKNSRNRKADSTPTVREQNARGSRVEGQRNEIDTNIRHERASSTTKGRSFTEHNKKK